MHTSSRSLSSGSVRSPSVVSSTSSEQAAHASPQVPVQVFEGHDDWVRCACFYPEGNKLVSGSYDKTLRIWDWKTGAVLDVLSGHTGWVQDVDVSRDGKMVISGSWDNTVRLWNGGSGEVMRAFEGHEKWVCSVGFSLNSTRVVSGSFDHTVRVWSVETGDLAFQPIKCHGWAACVRYSPSGDRIASGGTKGDVQIWDADAGAGILSIQHSTVRSLAWTPDGTNVVGGRKGNVTIWNSHSGEAIQTWEAHIDWIQQLCLSPNGTHLATCDRSDKTAIVLNLLTGKQVTSLKHNDYVRTITYSPSGQHLVAACNRNVYLWEGPVVEGPENESLVPPFPPLLDRLSALSLASPSPNDAGGVDQFRDSSSDVFNATHPMPQELVSSAEGHSSRSPPALPTTIDKGKGKDPHPSLQALAVGDNNTNSVTAWHLHDTRSNFPADLTGCVVREGQDPSSSGGFGDIYKGTLLVNGRSINVAVKAIRTYSDDDGDDARKEKRIRREIKTWLNLDHNNVIPLFGTTMNFGRFPAMVCPWLENGSLTSYLERPDGNLTTAERLSLVSDVAAGLQYLHSRSVVHGDLSGSNVLVDGKGRACISDFGLSTLLTQLGGSTFATSHQPPGTLRWTAPELLEFHEDEDNPPHIIPSTRSDVYPFGQIMLQILTGKVPYHYCPREIQVMKAISKREIPKRPRKELVTDRQWLFMQRCWMPLDAGEPRPGNEEIIEFVRQELADIEKV